MAKRPTSKAQPSGYQSERRVRKFTQAGALLSKSVRQVAGKRGFAEAKLLTRWTEICGAHLAAQAVPAKVSYARGGMGATLTLYCLSGRAPELEMQAEVIRSRINGCYGYNAISRIRLKQLDADGFAAARGAFEPVEDAPPVRAVPGPEAVSAAGGVVDPGLRAALEQLGHHVLARSRATRIEGE